eukprot:CAMPEP_0116872342 /NCGR_PEP_ID=MMETSP0463-20121206/3080_1 /TAXON_ID=181622 /ORGANISM="Strombidinopsis sp, Strain SopsisLIS2011" /LENGTH=81 /DNA_ID=CAMNT_0004512443 /DNA_START=622 /DNA_END=864 /DNA_ORIENTATION=-
MKDINLLGLITIMRFFEYYGYGSNSFWRKCEQLISSELNKTYLTGADSEGQKIRDPLEADDLVNLIYVMGHNNLIKNQEVW